MREPNSTPDGGTDAAGAIPEPPSAAVDGLRIAIADGLATIAFHRPGQANALTEAMLSGLSDALDAAEADPSIRAVILRGSGDRVFAGGSDLGDIDAVGPAAYAEGLYARSCAPRISTLAKPVIAAVNGDCIGAGIMLAIAADMRIAVSSARFGIPVGSLGFAFPVESVDRLVTLVGPGQASRLLYTGVRIDAAEARRIGLVEEVVEPAAFDAAVADAAAAIGRMSVSSLRASKLAIRAASDPRVLTEARALFDATWREPDTAARLANAIAKRRG